MEVRRPAGRLTDTDAIRSAARYERVDAAASADAGGEWGGLRAGQFKAYPFVEMEGGPDRFRDSFQDTPLEITFDERNRTAAAYGPDAAEIPTVQAFWFAWYAFHPDTDVYRRERTGGSQQPG